jgi:hypothetical protein
MGRRRIAWIAEDVGDDEQGGPMALGVFSAHVEGDDLPEGFESGPDEVSIDDALSWARARADVVVVRYDSPSTGTTHFSAGPRQPKWPEAPLPAWPPPDLDLSRRRLSEWRHLDRNPDDPPISWDVVVTITQGWGDPVHGFAADFAARLDNRAGVEVVDWVAGPGGGLRPEDLQGVVAYYEPPGNVAANALVRVEASTVAQAEEAACRAARACADAALEAAGGVERHDVFRWAVDAAAYPTGSEAAEMNAGIRFDED